MGLSDGLPGFEELWVLQLVADSLGRLLLLLELSVDVVGEVWDVIGAGNALHLFFGWSQYVRIYGTKIGISSLLLSSENFVNLLELFLLLLDLQQDSS